MKAQYLCYKASVNIIKIFVIHIVLILHPSKSLAQGVQCALKVANEYKSKLEDPYFARDKYKHCSISCLATIKCHAASSSIIGMAKEVFDIFGPGEADLLDMVANIRGIKAGLSSGASVSKCKNICTSYYPSMTPRDLYASKEITFKNL